jgi:histidyl-tRNA synthetase
MEVKPVKGTHDIIGADIILYQRIEDALAKIAHTYGYLEFGRRLSSTPNFSPARSVTQATSSARRCTLFSIKEIVRSPFAPK